MTVPTFFAEARKSFHAALFESVLRIDTAGVASNADKSNANSIRVARGIVSRLGAEAEGARLAGQMAGSRFEEICRKFETVARAPGCPPKTFSVKFGSA